MTAAVADDFSGVDTVAVRFENENGKAVSINLDYQGGYALFRHNQKEPDEGSGYLPDKKGVCSR